MKKVGIVSFPRYFNYGTYLQLHAMQRAVAQLGYQPEIVDYDPYNDSGKRVSPAGKGRELSRYVAAGSDAWKRLVARLSRRPQTSRVSDFERQRQVRFKQFLSASLPLGRKTYFSDAELHADCPACDAFIAGSDQIWHPVAHHEDSAYYLAFAERGKRIAYAPSFGVSEIPADSKDWIRQRLLEIPHLSVRETSGAALIRELTGRQARVVLDPVFLVEPQEWARFGASIPALTRPYLLCYFLESDRYMRDRALRIARSLGLLPVMVPVHPHDMERVDNGFERLPGVGPREFVDLVRQADFVCTDSFHGTAFSILFNRPFFTFRRYDNLYQVANHSRIASILHVTGLDGRVRGFDQSVADPGGVDFAAANRAIGALRQESKAFLGHALREATRTVAIAEVSGCALATC
jgi:hypothetical protein